ncbi:MAG: NAD(P)H-binding protein [Prolixibacteraceae bacterium]
MKTALIAGATGLVGKQLVNELIADSTFEKVIVLSRRELSISHPKLLVKLINFDHLNDLNFDEKIDVCFCSLGTTQKKSGREGTLKVDYEYVVQLAQLSKRMNISKFIVVSSQGANHNSSFFYMRTKGQMEEAIKKAGIETVYLVRPSLITGEREEVRFAEEIGYYLYKGLQPLMFGKLKKLRPVSGLQIARCMVDLSGNSEHGNFTIESNFIQSY